MEKFFDVKKSLERKLGQLHAEEVTLTKDEAFVAWSLIQSLKEYEDIIDEILYIYNKPGKQKKRLLDISSYLNLPYSKIREENEELFLQYMHLVKGQGLTKEDAVERLAYNNDKTFGSLSKKIYRIIADKRRELKELGINDDHLKGISPPQE